MPQCLPSTGIVDKTCLNVQQSVGDRSCLVFEPSTRFPPSALWVASSPAGVGS